MARWGASGIAADGSSTLAGPAAEAVPRNAARPSAAAVRDEAIRVQAMAIRRAPVWAPRQHRVRAGGPQPAQPPCAAAPDRGRLAARRRRGHKERTMAGTVEKKLVDLGITLHTPAPAIANYVPFVRT